jgi:hypothetical protein
VKLELLPTGLILLTELETLAPTDEELPLVKDMDKALKSYDREVEWLCADTCVQKYSPLVWLKFMDGIVIDKTWCRFFRARFITKDEMSWIARPAALNETDAHAVCLMPRPYQDDLKAALEWAPWAERDPIVEARIGFLGQRPRVIFFDPVPRTIH